ncbi:wax ester/triacylglycerol synthase family O-acyltransferase [Rhodococcus sp. DMU1]|uniref:WS/DGAT/MGAT family O-acyltransferase n=1 Tax=Rhodococcus TaxID=1827 RepID=UPI00143ED133|nr:wax ester/triacylglycerol synthase family O-acyltransferase [Rhodococcus sp. DMU1]QIX50360.1 wax ester/triacylglycerol synthase family O-acyltransferase [Rhodococcus sp. DMU1]
MRRLSGLDAALLYTDSPGLPVQIGGLALLDVSTVPGGYSFERLGSDLEARVAAVPLLRRRVVDSRLNPGHPVWVDDPDFDVGRHVRRFTVPPPGTAAELAVLCGQRFAQRFDRSGPLWETAVFEGLADGSVAVLTRIHHAVVDGLAGATLLAQLCDREPGAPPPRPESPGVGGANRLTVAAGGVADLATRPLDLARAVRSSAAMVPRWVGRARRGEAMAVPLTAPRTSFNRRVTGRRNVAFVTLDFAAVKAVKRAFGVTVNDVVLALCASVLRRYLAARGELPASPLVAAVPVSVHGRARGDAGNQISVLMGRLHTEIADPVVRLHAVAADETAAKAHHATFDPDLLGSWGQVAPGAAFGAALRLYSALRLPNVLPVLNNLVVSDIPGPTDTLYYLGARITALYPFGPIYHGAGLNITVLSLDGGLHFGLQSCPDLLPDLWQLADGFPAALAELADRVPGAPPAPLAAPS